MFCVSFFVSAITVLATLFTTIIIYFKWKYQYWQLRNLPYLEPKIPWGNSVSPFKRREQIGFRLKGHYDKMKSKGWKHGGLFLFARPAYMPVDLEFVKNIMTKDFQYFTDRGIYYNEKDDPLSAHLFALGGPKWRQLRTKLTPTFTSGKMKMMFQTLLDCVPNLIKKIDSQSLEIDIKEVLGCFTTDIIGSCAFGLKCNTFEDDDSPFRVYGRKVFQTTPSQRFKMIFAMSFPDLAKKLSVTTTAKDVTAFFTKMVKDNLDYRQKTNTTRNDFLQLLINLNNNGTTLTFEEILAQSFVFFIAGFETSSTTMTFALYELAKNQKIQDRLREEIVTVLGKNNGKITYEAIQDMKYMDQVFNETLRKYPPVTFLTRKCVQDYKVPNTDVVLEKGMSVMLPIIGIHYDEEYYPDPEKFDPERFTEENINARHHYAHIPFGEGPRLCIGMRFGLMQSKVGLATLLKNYNFTVNKKTLEPLKMKPNSFVLAAEGEVWLDAEKI